MNIPPLFHSAVPWELENYIRGEEAAAHEQAEGDIYHPPLCTFMPRGVERIARSLIEYIDNDRSRAELRGEPPHVPDHVKSWCYALHAYCHKYNEPAPEALVTLTFGALGCREAAPAPAVSKALCLVDDIRNMPAFLEAALLDGEADAAGDPLSVNALANITGISRDTVRRWRERPAYQHRRSFAAWAARERAPREE